MKKIKFTNNMPDLNENSKSCPSPSIKNLPEWYMLADKFTKNIFNSDRNVKNSNQKIPTWKACPGIFDAMTAGYVLKTPCDIFFYIDSNGEINVKIQDLKYKNFCTKREILSQFIAPEGFYKNSFAWLADWAIETESGYSILYITPANRFDLPFINTIGIMDTDKIGAPGSLPFFIKEGWQGLIPAGTPYAQIIPFKREDWEMQIEIEPSHKISSRMYKAVKTFRVPGGEVYKNKFWQKKKYI